VNARRTAAGLLILSGLFLCGLSARHYVRGWRAQAEGRRELAARMASASAPAPPSAPKARPAEAVAPAAAADNAVPAAPVDSLATVDPAARAADTGREREVPRTGIPAGYPYGEPVARLKIPAARIDAVVFGGADADVLEKGPGHVPGTELPGERSDSHNCVITGHRDSHFRNLGWLRPGHEIELEAPAGSSRYRVVSREIVTPETVRVLKPTAKERLTLITCYPFNWIGPAPKRLVVVAEPVSGHRS
jgi:sortase A